MDVIRKYENWAGNQITGGGYLIFVAYREWKEKGKGGGEREEISLFFTETFFEKKSWK